MFIVFNNKIWIKITYCWWSSSHKLFRSMSHLQDTPLCVRGCGEEIVSLIVHFLLPEPERNMLPHSPLPSKVIFLKWVGVWLGTWWCPCKKLRLVDFWGLEPPCRQRENLFETAFHFDNSLKSNILFLLGFNPLKLIKQTKQENHSLCLLDDTLKNSIH